ncbi:NRPS cluster protein [Microsporum audouinii]
MLPLSILQFHDELPSNRELHPLINDGFLITAKGGFTSYSEEIQLIEPANLQLESPIRTLWSRLLGVNLNSIEEYDDFFQCGGSASNALQLSQMMSEHGLFLTVRDIFRCSRLADLSARARSFASSPNPEVIPPFSLLKPSLDTRKARSHAAYLCHVKESQVLDIFPCTPLQEGMLALTRNNSNDYVQRFIYKIDQAIDIGRLRLAWDQVIAMNPILRTRVVSLPNYGIMQVVLDEGVQWIFESTFDKYQQRATPKELPMDLGDPLSRFAIVSGEKGAPCYLVWELHHALFDGWSIPLILDDVECAYYRETGPELLSMGPYIKYIQEIDKIIAHRFWTDQFAGIQGTGFPWVGLSAYTDPSPNVLTTIMTHYVSGLDWGRSDFTPATIVRAAWALVLAIRAGTNEALYGVTVTGRQAAVPGIEQMAGPAIATVPVRVKVDWERNTYQFLEAVQHQAADMIPFEQTGLQNIRHISEEAATACRFRSLLVIHPILSDDLQFPGRPFLSELARPPIEPRECNGRYTVDIDCRLTSNGIHANMEFDTRLIPKPEMTRVVQDFEKILQHLAGNVNGQEKLGDAIASISSFSLGGIPDVLTWNSQVPESVYECVHIKIEDKALECPRSLAIHAWDGTLEYQRLIETSNIFACKLAEMGVTGTLVPLLFEKSLWMPVAVLAVMKAGGTLVALDMKQPHERLAQIVSQTNSPVLICSEQNSAIAQTLGRQQFVVGWNQYCLDANNWQGASKLPVVRPESLLYVVFTSGSTGTPKGVRITHQNFCTAIAYQQKALGYNGQSRVIDFASYAFDVVWSNFFLTLTAGACLCIPSSQERENNLAGCLTQYEVNLMDSTPSLARALGREVLSKLTTLILGGETILPSDVLLAGDHTKIINAYGPAECTPTTLLSPLDATGVRIGRGVGVCTWVVEEGNPQQLAPVGTVGELWLEGPLVGDGYLDDTEKTAAAFVQDPIWLVQKAGRRGRVYRTGDLVRYEADGNIVFIGRKDHQVKIRGQRVELGEVESVIRQIIQQPTTRVVVEAIQQSPEASGLTLVAFIALHGSQTMDKDSHNTAVQQMIDGFASRLEELLPSYMIPAIYFPLQDIPMMATGKTDRKCLRVVGKTLLLEAKSSMSRKGKNQEDINSNCNEPLDETQTILQNTWMSVLNLSQQEASVDVAFSRLGGDSISAMQVVSQCRMHNIHLTVSDILLSRTIRNLAKRCQAASSQNCSATSLEDPMSLFDLSPIQRNFFDTYPEGLNHYNQSFLLDLKDPVSVTALEGAISAIVSRHAMLRARFEKDQKTNTWKQRIVEHSTKSFGFAEHTMEDHASVGIAAQRRQENMDIKQGPVFACDLFNLPKGSQMLLLSAHHLVMDLVSWRIIWADLEDHLQFGKLRSPETLSFQAWCAHQAQVGRTLSPLEVLPYSIPEPQLNFWGVPLEENTFGQCESVDIAFTPEVSSQLFGKSNDTFRTEGIDLILSALFHSFTHTFPERSVPAIWVEGHGREQPSTQPIDVSGTVGWFTTIYPLAIPISPNHSLARDIVRLVKDSRRKVPGKGQPFSACRYHSESGRLAFEPYDSPEIVFNFTGRFQQLEKQNGLFDSSPSSEPGDSDLTITENSKSARRPSMIDIEAGVTDSELKVEFVFHKMMDKGRLQTWVHNFTQDLELLSHDLAQASTKFTLSDLPLLSLSYKGLDILLDQQIPQMGIRPESILDIYPCSPLQEGMLISAAKGVASYHTHTVYRCMLVGETVCPIRLELAWKLVASRHTVLSSVFTLHPEGNGFIQMVLDKPPVRVIQIDTDYDNPATILTKMETPSFAPSEPQHTLTICRSNSTSEVAVRLDMDHSMNDAHSMWILLNEFAAAYDGSKFPEAAPSFVDIIRYIDRTPRAQTTATWAALLDGTQPCNFPTLPPLQGQMIPETFSEVSSSTPYSKAGIVDYCKKSNILISSFLQVAWAITLSHHTGMRHICFSYLTSGRDAPIDGVERMVGPLANLLISRIDLGPPVREVLQNASKRSEQNMAIQNVFIAEVLHRLGLSGKRLFNTSLSIRYMSKDEIPKHRISFITLDDEDNHEYDLNLNASVNSVGYTDLLIEFREPYITRRVAQQVYETLNQAIDYLLDVDFNINNENCNLEEESLVVNSHKAAGSLSPFDQFFARMCGVEKALAEVFWKDQFSGIRGGHFPEVKPAIVSQIEHDEEVHLSTKTLDFAGCDFAVDVIARAAWAILTARISHIDESLFGAGLRDGERIKHILPVRVMLDWDNSILHFLQKVEQQLREMVPFQRMCLEQISRVSDEASFACNFQTLIAIRSPGKEEKESHKISNITNGDTKSCSDIRGGQYAMIVEVEVRGKQTKVSINFDSRVVDADRALRLIQGFEHVIHQLLDVNRQKDNLRNVTVASQRDLNDIWTWNAELPPSAEGCVHDLILEKVMQRPHFTAVNAWDGDLTYSELHELSSKLAHQLLSKGIGRGSIVPLCFHKSKWMPVAALAVMKVGAASVAINTAFPEQRLRSIIAQVFASSSSRLLLSSMPNKSLCECLGGGEVHLVGENLLLPIASGTAAPQWPTVYPSDTFYIVFTSGTTGNAKGVVITHQNFYSAIAHQGTFLGFDSQSRVLEFTSYAFDVFWLNLLRALGAGGCLCIPSLEEFENDLSGCLERYRPTVLDLTPSVARIVEPKSALSKLSTLVLGGEAISPDDLDLVGEDTELIVAYGPAECTPTSTILYRAKNLEGGEIGRGVGVCTWVVDLENPRALAAVGAVGELWVEGPLVGEGYLNDPERTARVFIRDPEWLQRGSPDGSRPGRRGRLYCTGDLVRYTEDGSLVFLGRRDTQVKVRGQRVELGDLEHHIRATAIRFMKEAGTLASNGNVQVVAELVQLPGMPDKALAAFVALDSTENINGHNGDKQEEKYGRLVQQTMAGIRKQLEELLPRHMLPSVYIPIQHIPITATGKADRRALREMAASLTTRDVEALNRASVDSRVPPRTEKECLMQSLWAEVLKIEDKDRISASDSFFRVGGDSIAAMRIVAVARSRALEFTVRDVFQYPVLRDLCLQCRELVA